MAETATTQSPTVSPETRLQAATARKIRAEQEFKAAREELEKANLEFNLSLALLWQSRRIP